jgi:hypothetical protein
MQVETATERDALAGVCVVDEAGTVLLQTLVKPSAEVVDYRTELTGGCWQGCRGTWAC